MPEKVIDNYPISELREIARMAMRVLHFLGINYEQLGPGGKRVYDDLYKAFEEAVPKKT